MTTTWFFPNNITQYAEIEQHVAWTGEENDYAYIRRPDAAFLSTKKDLLHIANPTTNAIKMKTAFLYLTDFAITNIPDIVSGIEVEVDMNRGGRITDETIQLRYNDDFIGVNRANYLLDKTTIYGGDTDLWDTTNLTKEMISDSGFGLGIRYQSHPNWPHKESPKINYIRLRVW